DQVAPQIVIRLLRLVAALVEDVDRPRVALLAGGRLAVPADEGRLDDAAGGVVLEDALVEAELGVEADVALLERLVLVAAGPLPGGEPGPDEGRLAVQAVPANLGAVAALVEAVGEEVTAVAVPAGLAIRPVVTHLGDPAALPLDPAAGEALTAVEAGLT